MGQSRINNGIFSSRTDEWATPRSLFNKLDKEFHFDLDVAASSKNALCKKYFSKKEDGLKQDWFAHTKTKRVFCNPPYGKGVEKWLKKAMEESKKGCTVVCLIPFRTDTGYFHDYIFGRASEIRLIKGRLKYNDASQSAPFPSALIIYKNGSGKTTWKKMDDTGNLSGFDRLFDEKSNAFFRARIKAIHQLIEDLPMNREDKNPDRTLVRNGYIPDKLVEKYNSLVLSELNTFSNETLSFSELSSFNNWFVMHPEKVCGKEVVTTSREFPISIKGTKEDIINTIIASMINGKKADIPGSGIELNSNRFGSASEALKMTVGKFEENYFNRFDLLQHIQKPLEEKLKELNKELTEAGRDKAKRKNIKEKIVEVNGKIAFHLNSFDHDWFDFMSQLKEKINEAIIKKGLPLSDENELALADDILLAITERPGTEFYWNTRLADVIEKELNYYIEKRSEKKKNPSVLELEALALETELELLKI